MYPYVKNSSRSLNFCPLQRSSVPQMFRSRQDELVRRTQDPYNSLVSGNQAPWKKHFANDCIFADEKGRLLEDPKLIAGITPLPAGYSRTIKVENAQMSIIGNTAILSYDAEKTETIFGQNLKARYHITDTWLQRNGNCGRRAVRRPMILRSANASNRRGHGYQIFVMHADGSNVRLVREYRRPRNSTALVARRKNNLLY